MPRGVYKRTLRVHEGVLYEREKPDHFWWPATSYSLKYRKREDVPEAKIDSRAPLLCDCGSTEFTVKSPSGEYETTATCVKCGTSEVIHEG